MVSYFAYGSNQDETQMKERCPSAELVGKFVLKNYKLSYSIYSPKRKCGCADVIKSDGDEVWGLVYKITTEDLIKLDGFEAHPIKYKRFTTNVENEQGEQKTVELYEVVEKSKEQIPPSREYHEILIRAAEKYNYPDAYRNLLDSIQIQKSSS